MAREPTARRYRHTRGSAREPTARWCVHYMAYLQHTASRYRVCHDLLRTAAVCIPSCPYMHALVSRPPPPPPCSRAQVLLWCRLGFTGSWELGPPKCRGGVGGRLQERTLSPQPLFKQPLPVACYSGVPGSANRRCVNRGHTCSGITETQRDPLVSQPPYACCNPSPPPSPSSAAALLRKQLTVGGTEARRQ